MILDFGFAPKSIGAFVQSPVAEPILDLIQNRKSKIQNC
jgi:hypothetical protein